MAQMQAARAVLDRYMAGKLDSDAAALELTAPVAHAFHHQEEASAESWLWSTWGALLDVVRSIAYSDDPAQDALVLLLLTMRDVHMPANSAVHEFERRWRVQFWRDLPVLGPTVREDWDCEPPWPGNDTHCTREQWASMNAFLARLTAAHVLNFSVYGIWAMREVFEEPLGTLGLEWTVPAAAAWVLAAGRRMFELASDAQPPDGIANASNGGSLWAGRIWYNLERWAFWKQGFNIVMGEAELDSWTKEMAARAHQTMEQIESNHSDIIRSCNLMNNLNIYSQCTSQASQRRA